MSCKRIIVLLSLFGAIVVATPAVRADMSPPADQCGATVRLDSPGGTMEHVPVVDQGDWGICYSAAASQMVDAYELSHGEEPSDFQSSMLEGAVGTGIKQSKNWLCSLFHLCPKDKGARSALTDGGDVCDVANYYKKAGSCGTDILSKNADLHDQFGFLAKSYDILYPDSDDDGSSEKSDSAALARKIQQLLSQQNCSGMDERMTSFATTEAQWKKILKKVTEETQHRAFAILESACKERGRRPDRFSSCKSNEDPKPATARKTERFIVGYLSSKSVQPLGIGYCSKVLSAGAEYEGLDSGGNPKGGCWSHESLIIGKRRNTETNKCQFLIQNSWGTDCDSYPGKVAKGWECKDGKIWVDADVLSRNIEDYAYLK